MLLYWRVLLLIFFVLPCACLQAAEAGAGSEDFRKGVVLFQNGDLDAAKIRFESAIEAGLTSPSLFYNLGVTCYRLQEYQAAEAAFRSLLDGPNAALARYNLGLVALGQNDPELARAWFEKALESDAPDKIATLSRAQLAKLDAGAQVSVRQTTAQGYLSLSGGYDSNIAGLPEDTASSEGGGFIEALATGTVEWPSSKDAHLALGVAAYARDYPSESDYDSQVLQGQVAWSEPHSHGERGAILLLTKSWFGSRPFETRYGAEAFYRWRPCSLLAADQCGLSLAAAAVNGGASFDAYDGQWYRARFKARKYYGAWRLDGEYTLEVNDRRDLRTVDEVVSVSPYHHTLELASRYRWQSGLELGAVGSIRHSRYQGVNQVVPSAGESGRREDNRLEIGLLAEQSLDSRWLVRGEWLVRENGSSLSQYDYWRQTVVLTLEGVF